MLEFDEKSGYLSQPGENGTKIPIPWRVIWAVMEWDSPTRYPRTATQEEKLMYAALVELLRNGGVTRGKDNPLLAVQIEKEK